MVALPMRTSPVAFALLGLLALSLPADVAGQESPTPEGSESPLAVQTGHGADREIYAGVFLHDVADVQIEDGVFSTDFELWAKWRGEFDPDQLMIANAAEIERTSLGLANDRDWHVARWRCRGTLRGEFPMQAFPYDQQSVSIVLELPEEHGRLVTDAAGSGMAERFSLTDWGYEPEFHLATSSQTVASDLGFLSREGLPTTVHRATFEVHLIRPLVTVALKIFLPLAIIALVALIALFLPAEAIEPRAGVGVTALLSCFAFQFTLEGSLPAVSYLTLTDILFLIAYVLSTACLVESIVSHTLDRRGKPKTAVWTDRVSRVLLPIVGAIATALAIPEVPERPPREPDPVPEIAIPETAREELRIGSNRVRNALSSTLYRGVFWGLLKDLDGDDKGEPMHVIRRPGIDNDLLRFAADGTLEVTWHLRDRLAWSDGEPLTSQDVAFGFELWEDEHIAKVETPSPELVVVTWDGRLADALEGPEVVPHHLLGELFEVEGRDAVLDRLRHSATPVLGPYRWREVTPDERMVGEPNPEFIGPAPAIDRVEEIKVEPGELVQAFLDGAIDITIPNSVTMEEALAVREEHPESVVIRPSATYLFLEPDMSVAPFDRLPVRRALLQAIDREALAADVYGEAGRVAHTPIPDLDAPGIVRTAYDPDAARATLREEGVTELALIHDGSEMSLLINGKIRQYLEAVGVRVEDRIVESTFATSREGGHGGLLEHVIRGDRDAAPGRFWNVPYVDGNYDYDHRHDAYTDEIHALIERERHALYPERREQLRDALFALISERLPVLPLVFAAERILANPKLKGWDHGPLVRFGEGIERWYFEP